MSIGVPLQAADAIELRLAKVEGMLEIMLAKNQGQSNSDSDTPLWKRMLFNKYTAYAATAATVAGVVYWKYPQLFTDPAQWLWNKFTPFGTVNEGLNNVSRAVGTMETSLDAQTRRIEELNTALETAQERINQGATGQDLAELKELVEALQTQLQEELQAIRSDLALILAALNPSAAASSR